MIVFFETIAVAFGMFSALPFPQVEWNRKNMRYSLCVMPLIGLVIGLFCALWAWLSHLYFPGSLLSGAGFFMIPIAVTGGFHLDGFADTCDARASHADPARRQEILKDSHVGAFAVIHVCCYCIFYFALSCTLRWDVKAVLLMGLGYMLERAFSGAAVCRFTLAKNSGLAYSFANAAHRGRVGRFLLFCALALCVGMLYVGRLTGLLMVAAALTVLAYYHRVAQREFGGVSGDLAGWFLQLCEIAMLAALTAGQLIFY